jgi:glycosyltransferase involved in cell wall biosynthesis
MHHYLSPGSEACFSSELKEQVQRRAADFDLLVFDHFYAFYYRPQGYRGKTIYHAHAAHFVDIRSGAGDEPDERITLDGMRKREIDACASVDHVFVTADDALRLADAGVPFGKLQCALSKSRYQTYKSRAADFNTTKPQLVYVGYLGDQDNVRSLLWFIRQVLPQLRATMPGLALHLVGRDPALELLSIAMSDRRIHFHNSLADAEMAGESFRVSIDPLLYEGGVDTKLVNALARGTPTVTTRAGVARMRGPSLDSIAVAESSRDMALQIRRLLTDKSSWRSMARGGVSYARQHLPTHDMVFRLRQQLARQPRGGIAA